MVWVSWLIKEWITYYSQFILYLNRIYRRHGQGPLLDGWYYICENFTQVNWKSTYTTTKFIKKKNVNPTHSHRQKLLTFFFVWQKLLTRLWSRFKIMRGFHFLYPIQSNPSPVFGYINKLISKLKLSDIFVPSTTIKIEISNLEDYYYYYFIHFIWYNIKCGIHFLLKQMYPTH